MGKALVYRTDVYNSLAMCYKVGTKDLEEIMGRVKDVEAIPVERGMWIDHDEIAGGHYRYVSECSGCEFTTDKLLRSEMKFCPNCGLRMSGR